MFGYVRPFKPELKIKEFEWFRAAYCGVCNALSARYGFWARMTLHYDFAFLALVLQEKQAQCAGCRCPAHPFRKRCAFVVDEACAAAADAGILMACGKWEDTILDEGFWRSLPARFFLLLFWRKFRKAKERRPAFYASLREGLRALHALEEENAASLDRPADAFARVLEALAPEGDRARAQLLYHVGRCLYIIDAADDYPRDSERKRYNAVKSRFALDGKPLSDEVCESLRQTLALSCNQALLALQLLPETQGTSVLENILGLGLPDVFENVLKRNLPNERRL